MRERTLTKERLKKIIKRLPYILRMMREGKNEMNVYISGEKEKIVIDSEVLVVMDIMDEIVENEEIEWCRIFFTEIKKGCRDISIIPKSPMGRTKYYDAKKEFIERIYQCCIYRGMVEYEDILKSKAR